MKFPKSETKIAESRMNMTDKYSTIDRQVRMLCVLIRTGSLKAVGQDGFAENYYTRQTLLHMHENYYYCTIVFVY